jgi:hypothetical protein
MVLGKEYELRGLSLYNLLGPDIFFRTLCPMNVEADSFTIRIECAFFVSTTDDTAKNSSK